MPGDINTYALGIEFNLSATKAMATVKDLTKQAENLHEQFGKAIEINIMIMRAFVRMRELISNNAMLAAKISSLM